MDTEALYRTIIKTTATCIFLLFVGKMLGVSKAVSSDEFQFNNDEAYIAMASARTLHEAGHYGISTEQQMPAMDDTLWNLLSAAGNVIPIEAASVLVLLNFIFIFFAFWKLLKIGRLMDSRIRFDVLSAIALCGSASLILHSASGTATAMALFFVASGTLSHLNSLIKSNKPVMSIGAAISIGLASMVQIEFIMLWVVFLIHALIVSLAGQKKVAPLPIILRFVAGVFVLGICIWPMIHQNMSLLSIPWPMNFMSSVSLDLNPEASFGAIAGKGMGFLIPGFFHMIFILAGIVLAAISLLKDEKALVYLSFPILIILTPLFTAGVSTATGIDGTIVVAHCLTPLLILCAALGFTKAADLVLEMVDEFVPDTVKPFLAPTITTLGAVILFFSLNAGGKLKYFETSLQNNYDKHEGWVEWFEDNEDFTVIATDKPGRVAWISEEQVFDLNGECNVDMLRTLSSSGKINDDLLIRILEMYKPSNIVLWEDRLELGDIVAQSSKLKTSQETAGMGPRVVNINWPN